MSTINNLIDACVRCTICGQPKGCDCWEECWCGWLFERGKVCRRDHDAYLAGQLSCECGVPFGTRQDCGAERRLKNPCRCVCHRADHRAGRERYEAAIAAGRMP